MRVGQERVQTPPTRLNRICWCCRWGGTALDRASRPAGERSEPAARPRPGGSGVGSYATGAAHARSGPWCKPVQIGASECGSSGGGRLAGHMPPHGTTKARRLCVGRTRGLCLNRSLSGVYSACRVLRFPPRTDAGSNAHLFREKSSRGEWSEERAERSGAHRCLPKIKTVQRWAPGSLAGRGVRAA